MSRLIDADALKAYMQDKYVLFDNTLADIDAQPTVDAVEVVRCKECKWSYWQDETEWTYEGLYCRQYEASMHDDDYCSRGERRNEQTQAY